METSLDIPIGRVRRRAGCRTTRYNDGRCQRPIRRDQIHPIDNAEVLVGCPPLEALGYMGQREREGYMNSLHFLETEARARAVAFIRFSSPHDAAQHLVRRMNHAA